MNLRDFHWAATGYCVASGLMLLLNASSVDAEYWAIDAGLGTFNLLIAMVSVSYLRKKQ